MFLVRKIITEDHRFKMWNPNEWTIVTFINNNQAKSSIVRDFRKLKNYITHWETATKLAVEYGTVEDVPIKNVKIFTTKQIK